MPEFIPLPFYCYDWRRSDIRPELATAPPYDVLSPEQREALAAKSPYNLVHVDLPKSYAQAGHILNQWRVQGVLQKAEQPMFAALASRYSLWGQEFVRWGFMGGLRLSPWGQAGIYPHEQTYPKAKTDRLELMRATRAQLSPIFGVFNFAGGELQAVCDVLDRLLPMVQFQSDDGVEHRLWPVPQDQTRLIATILKDCSVYIADGHHRYETALTYAQEQGTESDQNRPWDHVFACLCNIASPGLEILPYHRMVTTATTHPWAEILLRAEEWFSLRRVSARQALDEEISPSATVLVLPGEMWLLTLKSRHLSQCDPLFADIGAYVLDTFFFRKTMGLSDADLAGGGHLTYTPFGDQAADNVAQGTSQAALLLKPVDMGTLRRVSESGRVMPRKSTFFHPKLPGGLLFHLWD
jgi:uncharacterized protein (DUF1015 family)